VAAEDLAEIDLHPVRIIEAKHRAPLLTAKW